MRASRPVLHASLIAAAAIGACGLALAQESGCADCHDPSPDPQALAASAHGSLECVDCHSAARDLPHSGDPSAVDCAACHDRQVSEYGVSVHGQARAHGEAEAPGCSACHGDIHRIAPRSDSSSPIFYTHVPATCGGCHVEIARQFRESVHGTAVEHGVREAPVCTDCHGEHRILSPDLPGSPVAAANVSKMTCGRCHGDLRLADKYDMPATAVPAYEDSYHGLASRSGSVSVANCGSCHGVHDILPSSDPRSHVAPANLSATCGKCHPGAGERFAIGTVHVLATEPRHAAVYWVRRLYLWLIGMTIGAMLLHNGLDLYRKVRCPLPAIRPDEDVPPRERMLPGFRLAHACLIVSFGVLVYTGFALKYPESFWAAPLLAWEDRFGFRGLLHRSAAVLLLGALAMHAAHLIVSRRARRCIAGMRPSRHDLVELRERVRWLVGRRAEPPKSPPLGYPEKVEYLALMWGIAVMTVTGFMLWFENPMLRWLPKWLGDVATAIHFYEAILASLAIVVWHFYFVIFDPRVYPMDLAWLTGREHPARAAERSGGSSSALVDGLAGARVDGDIERRHRA